MRASPEICIQIKLRRILSAILAISLIIMLVYILLDRIILFIENRYEIERLRINTVALTMNANKPGTISSKSLLMLDLPDFFAQNLDTGVNHIQNIVKNLNESLGTNDIQIDSVRILPPIEEGMSIIARASVAMMVPYNQVFNVINIIESSVPAIAIDTVRINNRTNNNLQNKINSMEQKNTAMKNRVNLTLVLRVYSNNSQYHNNLKNATGNSFDKKR